MKKQIWIVIFLVVATSFSAWADLNGGLAAYYPFNGNAYDVTGNGYNGTSYNTILTSDRFGNLDSALQFNGVSSDVEVTNIFSMQGEQTLSVWIKPATSSGYQPILEKAIPGFGGEVDFQLRLPNNSADGTVSWLVNTDNGSTGIFVAASSQSILPVGQWSFLTCVIDQSENEVRLCINGVLSGTGSMGGRNVRNTSRPFRIGKQIGQQVSLSFNGLIDDVRIYDRALSPSEVQQLYSTPDIGSAPAVPTVVQATRTPNLTELGVHTSGSFKVFKNGAFQNNLALNASLMTIVLTHGWNDSSDSWPSTMANQFVAGGISANLVAWDWRDDAKQTFPQLALLKTPAQGYALETNLLQALGTGYSLPIHFIGHSFGTEVNSAAADYLQKDGFAAANIEMTLFDEAEIGNDLRIVSPATWNLGWISPLPHNFVWSDNYVSLVGELQNNPKTVNVILTENQPSNFYANANDLWNALINYHGMPCQWYGQTILNPGGSVMGNSWSFERNSNFTSPAGGTYFLQQGNDLSLSQISQADAEVLRPLNSLAFPRDLAMLATLKGVGASVQVAGDVTANVIDDLLDDPVQIYTTTPTTVGISSYAPATPEFWSPQLIFQTEPLSAPMSRPASLPRPQDNSQSASSNSPAYAWVPMTLPTNDTSLSFDFMVKGNGARDSFAAAVDGTNVFSLPLNLLQTNVLMNSGTIDVSAYAGTNIELFLGIVGGTSTNAKVTVSGIRIYATLPPSMQLQASGNNLAVSWPISAQNFDIQTTTNLADQDSWMTLTNTPAILNLQDTVTNSTSDVMRFYRLKQ